MGSNFNYVPHAGQLAIHASGSARFRTVCCGRRWGKTLCLAAELLDRAGGEAAGDYGWIAPTYFIAERGIEALRSIAGDFISIGGRNPVRCEFTGAHGTSRILFLSADNPESILGLGFKGIVVDEAARIPADVWHYTIRPTLAQTLGWATLISTPNGRGWFYDMHTRGNDPAETDYKSFHFASNTNPFFPSAEWEEAKRTMPEDVFRQEYMAEFLEDSAGVFHNVEYCIVDGAPSQSAEVVIGCDLAKHTDHTVLISMDRKTGACLEMDRFNQLDWPIQKERIVNFYRRRPGLLVMDATGIGDPIYDDLKTVIPQIQPVKLTNISKSQLVQRLIVAVEQRQISWPRSWSVLTDEMKRYEYEILPSGTITYNAPGGYHDDCVMALALANSERLQYRWTGGMKTFCTKTAPMSLKMGGAVSPIVSICPLSSILEYMANYRTKPGIRDHYNPLRGLSLSRIVAMEEAAARGDWADLQWLWHHMQETDVTVASAVAKRLSYIESLDWEIRSIENADAILAAEQEVVLRYAYERVQNLQEAAKHIAFANFTGYSMLEKVRTGYGPFIQRLDYIPCQYWSYKSDKKQWSFNPEARSGGNSGGAVADPSDLIIHEAPSPLFKPICRHFFAKQLALADWDVALENGANQAVFMIGPPGTTPEKETEYMSMAEALTSNMRGYLPPGSDIKITDLAARSKLPYFDRIEYSDRQIVMAATGGLLTMLTESGSGTLAGAAHSETLVGLARADAAAISEVFQRQFDREILKAFFPTDPIAVYFKFDIPRAQETTAQLIEASSALSWAGYRINQQQLEEKLGLKIELIDKGT